MDKVRLSCVEAWTAGLSRSFFSNGSGFHDSEPGCSTYRSKVAVISCVSVFSWFALFLLRNEIWGMQSLPTTSLRFRPAIAQSKTRNVLVSCNAAGEIQHWHITSGATCFDTQNNTEKNSVEAHEHCFTRRLQAGRSKQQERGVENTLPCMFWYRATSSTCKGAILTVALVNNEKCSTC